MKIRTQNLRSLAKLLNYAGFARKNGDLSYEEVKAIESTYNKSRRDFLINSSKTLAVVGIASAIPFSGCLLDDKKKPEIAIIGGGIAGLYAAYYLQLNKIRAQVYEADVRVGGRMYSARNIFGAGTWTELGGEFIDTAHLEIWKLIHHFGLETIDTHKDAAETDKSKEFNKEAFFVSGKRYSKEEVFEQLKLACAKIEADRDACKKEVSREKQQDSINMQDYVNGLPCKQWMKDIILAAYTGEYGADPADQSSLGLIYVIVPAEKPIEELAFFGDSDERYKVKNGNQNITDSLYGKVKEQVNLSYKLTAISSNGKKTTMKFANGKEVTADYVIMTLPFSVLRNIEMKIDGMPEDKLHCIKTLGYGQNSKVLMGFNKRVWREEDPKKVYAGYLYNPVVVNGWDNSHMQNDNKGKGGYSLLLGGKKSTDLAAKFPGKILASDLTDGDVKVFMDELDLVFPGMKANSANNNKAMLWPNNPHSLGSYTSCKPGQVTTLTHELIASTVGNIYFAGEHTSKDHQGFMNGGAESGRIAAAKILDALAVKTRAEIDKDGKVATVQRVHTFEFV